MRLALIGYGQIARTQHVPAIRANPFFSLSAIVEPSGGAFEPGVPAFGSLDALLASGIETDGVVICTPPRVRHDIARQALLAGMHVMVEKPPTQTVAEGHDLAQLAQDRGLVIYAAWHSRYAAAVTQARDLIETHGVQRVRIVWQENGARWHPGTDWFWAPGGFGTFDAGINGISLAQSILPVPLLFGDATLYVARGHAAPGRADVTFTLAGHAAEVTGHFDFQCPDADESWRIEITLGDGSSACVSDGGARLLHEGRTLVAPPSSQNSTMDHEYPRMFARFAALLEQGASEVDMAPLALVTDILAFGKRVLPYHEQ